MEKEYNGWTNYETWAVKLHWDNNEGDNKFFNTEARAFKNHNKSVGLFADWLKAQAEEIQESVLNGTATEEAKMFIKDAGSLWRVNWIEIAEAYYADNEKTEDD